MWTGDVVADRFVIDRPIGSGAMGSVFLATDRVAGNPVALKVLNLASDGAVERFRREARVLSELSHPGIVRYIAHGETDARQPFLAMELLEGEDLAQRLARGGLSVEDGLGLVRKVAEALAFAHTRGIVHRDVKPSNLFLVGCDVDRVKVLDFGIARANLQTQGLTQTGAMLGTVGYMAPEQAMGSRDVDPRADVFALGCVLFACLTGEPAFSGQHAIAVLAKVLTEQAPRVSEFRPDLGSALDDLVARMLAKSREDRPSDLTEVLTALDAVDSSASWSSRSPVSQVPTSVTHAERRIVSIILAEPAEHAGISPTATSDEGAAEMQLARQLALRTSVEFMPLQGGALLFVVSGRGTANDQAIEAATCAMALRRLLPDLRVALTTGRADTTSRLPVGPAIDRAAALLRAASGLNHAAAPLGVLIDDATAGLVSSRFDITHSGDEPMLVGERGDFDAPRLLMGKATPTVGRDRELAILEATLVESVDESVSRAVLVTAPPGVGKSRLATEFLRRVNLRSDVRVLVARADAMGAGSSLALARRLIVQAVGLRADAPPSQQQADLRQYVRERVPADRADLVSEFLGEIVGSPTDRAPSPILRAARNDPAVMQEQGRRAFEAWIDAEVARRPLLVVLEDLHWGDVPSVRYLDEALRRLADRPLMVLALARPEVHEHFPKLWEAQGLQEIRLGGLTRKSAERLVRAVLGDAADTHIVIRVVERAEGNAFYVEELVRRVADGDMTLPETVLAMVQARLEQLEPEARRVLRAASVFGATFWASGVASMLGGPADVEVWLETLSDREILVRRRESRFPGELEFVFRHGLLRDAAYAMLTDEDRRAAHRAAGDWLERTGERDAAILAEHFEQGDAGERALPWLVRAALAAMEMDGLEASVALATRGMELGAAGVDRGILLVILANGTSSTTTDYTKSDLLRQALDILPAGSLFWWSAISRLIWMAAAVGRPEEAIPFVQLAFTTRPAELSGLYGEAVMALATGMFSVGQVELARSFLEQFDSAMEEEEELDPVFVAWIDAARCELAYNLPYREHWRLECALVWGRRSAARMAEAGKTSGEVVALIHIGYTCLILGAYEESEAALTRAVGLARGIGLLLVEQYANVFLGMLETRLGRLNEARRLLEPLHASLDATVADLSRAATAEAFFQERRFDLALPLAQAAADGPAPRARRWGGSLVADIYLATGRLDDALVALDRAFAEPVLMSPEGERMLLVVRADVFRARGDKSSARAAICEARDLILTVADGVEDTELRLGFLTKVEGNARALSLAEAWLGEEAS